MTWALCLNCGETKFGAICPCPKCQVASTGDMNLDIAFSDHRLMKDTLAELGNVIRAIREVTTDQQAVFWTFIYYVSTNHPSILHVDLKPDAKVKCEQILSVAVLPKVRVRESASMKLRTRQRSSDRRWWQFWKR